MGIFTGGIGAFGNAVLRRFPDSGVHVLNWSHFIDLLKFPGRGVK